MHIRFAIPAAVVAVAVAVAACSGGQPSTYVAPPSGASAPTTGALALGANGGQTQSAGTASGATATLTYAGGSGTVMAASSATNPAGTVAVSPAMGIRLAAATSATSPNVYYLTISSTAGATLNAIPAVNLVLSAPAVGTFQEAQFANGKWSNINTAAAVTNASSTTGVGATSVSFPPGKTVVTIPANGSIFLAFYQGTFPSPTPQGALANNVLADPGFEGGFATPPAAVNSTQWTQCTITGLAPGVASINRALTTFTPSPGTTPGAVILSSGTALATPSSTSPPIMNVTTVQVTSPSHAAVFGGVFSNFDMEDWRYNGLCQTVTVPANPGMQFQVLANGNDGSQFADFEVDALNSSNQFLGNIYEDPNPVQTTAPTSPGDASYRTVSVPATALSPYAGMKINLFVGLWVGGGNSAKFGTYYMVDDFNLTAGS